MISAWTCREGTLEHPATARTRPPARPQPQPLSAGQGSGVDGGRVAKTWSGPGLRSAIPSQPTQARPTQKRVGARGEGGNKNHVAKRHPPWSGAEFLAHRTKGTGLPARVVRTLSTMTGLAVSQPPRAGKQRSTGGQSTTWASGGGCCADYGGGVHAARCTIY